MTAKDAISRITVTGAGETLPVVGDNMPLLDVLPRLLDSPGRRLEVSDGNGRCGVIDQTSMLEALGRLIAARDDSSVVTMECAPGDFSASHIARAVEDADVHLVDMLTTPGDDGQLVVTLRVRCQDPTSVVHSLERYGYSVTDAYGENYTGSETAMERILALRTLLNV